MVIRLKKLILAFKALKNSPNLGDFALLKADALGAKANPEIAQQMEKVKGYYPFIDLVQLSQLPPGTFGYEYALHMQKNQLQPLNISPELEETAQDNVFALRYIVTHDIFHVLLDFDTSYSGEIGVLAFAVEQNYSRSPKISLWVAQCLYPILAPQQFKAIFANVQKGKQMGKTVDFLLSYRFEDYWTEPLNAVRARLGIREK